jgi:predicted nucleotidyltransferase
MSTLDASGADDVLSATIEAAQAKFDGRLASVYALGSLAHGGFSPGLSDVDVGLVLEDRLRPADEGDVAAIKELVVARGNPLAERLSLFWGSIESLRDALPQGRFPPLDRLDLILHGRLLLGRETRAGFPKPSREELVVGAVRFALEILGRPEEIQHVLDPALLIRRGPRTVSKRVLFPVRFLYTARTGEIGPVENAADHYSQLGGVASALVFEAVRWRSEPPDDLTRALGPLSDHLQALYVEFLDDHIPRMTDYGKVDLAEALRAWRSSLTDPRTSRPAGPESP